MAKLAERTQRIAGSPTQAVTALVDKLRRSGVEVIDFGAGEPDFPTVEGAKAAAHKAIDANFSKYTPNAGAADLKRAILDRYRTDYGVEYSEAEVIVTAGGKQALNNTALALFGPGDEVITHAPYWPTIPEQVKLADATPVPVETRADDGFAIRAAAILRRSRRGRAGSSINSPCNPTGAMISEADFETIGRPPRENIWLVVDLLREAIYDPVPHNLPAIVAHLPRRRGPVRFGVERHAMTGWRCGWALGPAAVIAACNAMQSNSTSNASSITQKAVVEALNGSQEPVRAMLAEYRERRDRLHEWLTADPRIKCHKPGGAFYMFVDVSQAVAACGMKSTTEFAQALLEESKVAVTPGEAFGAPGFLRISYATSMENLREGSRRMLEFVRARAGAVATAAR